MLNLEYLRQLVAFADCGTLSAAATACNVSQPTLTRNMQMVEEDFGVPLFIRSKNRIVLNETGQLAVQNARNVLSSADSALNIVRSFDRAKRMIQIESCAPAPLWTLIPKFTGRFPEMTLSSEIIADSEKIVEDVREDNCSIGVVLYPVEEDGLLCRKYMEEALSICLPKGHELVATKETSVTFEELNGYNCLLRSQLGFWSELVYRKMPASKFLVQADDFAMEELIKGTELPFFVTNLSIIEKEYNIDRVILPIEDKDATVSYYLVSKSQTYLRK